MAHQFTSALDEVDKAHAQYGEQLGLVENRTPFTAESLPDAQVAVRVNEGLLQEVASHILTRAGHVSIIDKRGAGKTHFRELVYDALSEGRAAMSSPSSVSGKSRALLHGDSTHAFWMDSHHMMHWKFQILTPMRLTKSGRSSKTSPVSWRPKG